MGSLADVAPSWERTTWKGEPAWAARSGPWRAVVSEERCRLIELSDAQGRNLFYTCSREESARQEPPRPPTGGHVFWLGPQSAWPKSWPPALDWDGNAAKRVTASGTVLEVEHAHTNANLPQLFRRYSWEQGRLRCDVRWEHAVQPFCAVQIFQMPATTRVLADLTKTAEAPQGFVQFPMWNWRSKETRLTFELPVPCVEIRQERASITHRNLISKFGFNPEPLEAVVGTRRLTLSRGATRGQVVGPVDGGYVTEVFVGGQEAPFVEIEQLSPLLGPDAEGVAGFTVFLTPQESNAKSDQVL